MAEIAADDGIGVSDGSKVRFVDAPRRAKRPLEPAKLALGHSIFASRSLMPPTYLGALFYALSQLYPFKA